MGSQDALLAGASIGLAIAAPIGPMAIIVIRRTLVGGFLAGIVTGAGASTIHLFYATLAVSGLNQITPHLQQNRRLIDLVIACCLTGFAVKMLRHRVTRTVGCASPTSSLFGAYASALGFCLINPMTFALLLSAIAAMTEFSSAKTSQTSSLAAGVFAGSIGWWICLVGMTALVGIRLSPRSMRVIDIIAGTVLFALAASTILRTL